MTIKNTKIYTFSQEERNALKTVHEILSGLYEEDSFCEGVLGGFDECGCIELINALLELENTPIANKVEY